MKVYRSVYNESIYKNKSCEIKYSIEDENIIVIENIEVPLNQRGKGLAKQTLIKFLNKFSNYRIEGHAYPQDEFTNLDKLLNFYKSLGFEIGSGDDKYGWEIYKN